jgi:hypothetical protein
MKIPSLWDARVAAKCGSVQVLCTLTEWELLLAVVLGLNERIDQLGTHLRSYGFDNCWYACSARAMSIVGPRKRSGPSSNATTDPAVADGHGTSA